MPTVDPDDIARRLDACGERLAELARRSALMDAHLTAIEDRLAAMAITEAEAIVTEEGT